LFIFASLLLRTLCSQIHFLRTLGCLSTAATGFFVRLGIGGAGQEFFPAVLAAEVGRLSIAFGVESGGGVDGHAADGIDCFGIGFTHGFVSALLL
jgi:hypothetical protein